MTDDTTDTPGAESAPIAAAPAPATALSGKKSKAFWAGVGIGSAAIIAAVMYTRRPKKRK
jgi:hypothetical protein